MSHGICMYDFRHEKHVDTAQHDTTVHSTTRSDSTQSLHNKDTNTDHYKRIFKRGICDVCYDCSESGNSLHSFTAYAVQGWTEL